MRIPTFSALEQILPALFEERAQTGTVAPEVEALGVPTNGPVSRTSSTTRTSEGAFLGTVAELMTGQGGLLRELGTKLGTVFELILPREGDTVPLDARAQAIEDRAFEVLEALAPKELGQAEAAFGAWFADVEAKVARKEPLEAMEHLTLLHILKRGLFSHYAELEPYVAQLEATLVASDQRYFGKVRSLEQILASKLPAAFLSKQSSDARKIHNAIFAPAQANLTSTLSDLFENHAPGAADRLIAVGLLGTLFASGGAQLLAGAVHGYILATLTERALHKNLGHASVKSLERLKVTLSRFGPIGEALYRFMASVQFSHAVVHHGSYAGNYVDRFAPNDASLDPVERAQERAQRRAKIEEKIDARGPEEAAAIRASDYGVTLTTALQDALFIAPLTTVVTLFSAAVAGQVGLSVGAGFVGASVLASLLFLPASQYLHPYLHLTKEEAFQKAGPAMRRFLESDYVSHIARAHYVHHHNAQVNQNLVAGADYAFGYAAAPVDAIVALRKLHTFY